MRARKALSLFLCLTLTAAAGCGRPSAPPDSSAAAQPEGSAAGTDVSAAADAEPEGTPWDSEESLEWYCELSRKTNPGDLSRTVEFLRRAQAGEELTVGFIGGSITQGAPGPGARYLYPRLVCNWLEEQYPQSSFELVNVAVGATDSLYGVHRADGQLLSADPDLVFVEYSANDPLEPLYDETYESLCRKILNWRTKPALMTVSMCWADFQSTLPIHVKTNRYYDIPLIGYRDAVYMGVMSKERVLAALRHEPVDRVPRFIWLGNALSHQLAQELGMTGEQLSLEYLHNDVVSTWVSINGEMERDVPQGTTFIDEWGITWKRDGDYNMVIRHPLAGLDAAAIAAYPFPQPQAPQRFAEFDRLKAAYGDTHLVGADVSGSIFEPAYHLRGMEELLMDMVCESEEAEVLLEHTMRFSLETALLAIEHGADWIWLGDDLDSQQNMLMSPDCWRRLIKPRMKTLIDGIRARRPDIPIAYHSCGSIRQVVGDLVELGLDLINPLQESARNMNHLEIKAEFGGRITMMCGPDTQDFLLHASPQEVYEKTRQLIRDLGRGGGCIFAVSHTIQCGTPKANIDAMLRALDE